jgi:hypothetical protein
MGSRTAHAQVDNNAFVRNYILSQPTVSPYLNLLRRDGAINPNYQTLVRPQIEFRQAAELQQFELQRVQQQLNVQRASIDAIRQQQSQRVFETGHTTRFMNLGGFFPGFAAGAQRRTGGF